MDENSCMNFTFANLVYRFTTKVEIYSHILCTYNDDSYL